MPVTIIYVAMKRLQNWHFDIRRNARIVLCKQKTELYELKTFKHRSTQELTCEPTKQKPVHMSKIVPLSTILAFDNIHRL